MGIIGEITEGFINGIYKIFKTKKKKSSWEKLSHLEVPSWVERASHRFHNKHPVRHHDLRKDFKGDYYLYRVIYKKEAHGRVREEFYRKRKSKP